MHKVEKLVRELKEGCIENPTPQEEAFIKIGEAFRESCVAIGDSFRESCMSLGDSFNSSCLALPREE